MRAQLKSPLKSLNIMVMVKDLPETPLQHGNAGFKGDSMKTPIIPREVMITDPLM